MNSVKTLIQNDGSIYNLSHLQINHHWSDTKIADNDLNINLFNMDGVIQSNLNAYEQITTALNNKFADNEDLAFNNIHGWFERELLTNPNHLPLYFLIKDKSSNWGNVNNPITKEAFKAIEDETNNAVYSLNLEAKINDINWDPQGIFDFSVNITSINYKTPIDVFTKDIQKQGLDARHGLNASTSCANNKYVSTAPDPNQGYTFPFTSISNLFAGLDDVSVINKYIENFNLNFDLDTTAIFQYGANNSVVNKDSVDQQFNLYNDYLPGHNFKVRATGTDSKIFDQAYDQKDVEKSENAFDISDVKNIQEMIVLVIFINLFDEEKLEIQHLILVNILKFYMTIIMLFLVVSFLEFLLPDIIEVI